MYLLEEDGEEQVHPTISSIFMEAATEAIQNMSDVSCIISGIMKYSPLFFSSMELFLILASQRELVNSMETYF